MPDNLSKTKTSIPDKNAPPPVVTKDDLVRTVSEVTGIVALDVLYVLQTFMDTVTHHLSENANVVLRNFGSFEVLQRKPKIGRNPRYPDIPITIPAKKVVRFKSGKNMKNSVNGKDL